MFDFLLRRAHAAETSLRPAQADGPVADGPSDGGPGGALDAATATQRWTAEPATPAATAWPMALMRWLRARQTRRGAALTAALCLGIAAFNTLVRGYHPVVALTYAFSVGLGCWWISESMIRVARALYWQHHPERRLGVSPEDVPWLGMPMTLAAAVGFVGVAAGVAGGRALAHTLLSAAGFEVVPTGGLSALLTIAALATLMALAGLHWLEQATRATAQAETARREATEAQLRLLQAQLEPHMLFNTLANLRALILLDPPRAQQMLDRLNAFLRSSLQASRQVEHPLSAEFERLRDYLDLMAVRLGPRLRWTLDLPAELAPARIPVMLLQPVVENALRHGIEPKVEGGTLSVRALAQDGELRLYVHDDGVGLAAGITQPPSPSAARAAARSGHLGYGVDSVRQRLAGLYPGQARLEIGPNPEGSGTRVLIALPLAQLRGLDPFGR